ncbi:MAG: DMT family transporter, partial [Promethearchaeota archaeon]
IISLSLKKKIGMIKPMLRRHYKSLIFIGTVCFGLAYIMQYTALPLTTTINQAILLNLQVFFVILINKLHFKQKTSWHIIIGVIIAFIGVIFINIKNDLSYSFSTIWGDLLTIVSCIFWGFFTALSKPICDQEENDPLVFNTIIIFIAIITLVPIGAISPTGFIKLQFLNPLDWFGVIWLGVACIGITYVVWFGALKETDNSAKVAAFVYLEPVFAGIFVFIGRILGFWDLQDFFTWFSLIGMILCILGVSIAQLKGTVPAEITSNNINQRLQHVP